MTPPPRHLTPDIVPPRPQRNPARDDVTVHHGKNPQRKSDQGQNLQRAVRKQNEKNAVEVAVLPKVLRNLNDSFHIYNKILESLESGKH